MAKNQKGDLPARPLDFKRFIESEPAGKILSAELLKQWGKILGWKLTPKELENYVPKTPLR